MSRSIWVPIALGVTFLTSVGLWKASEIGEEVNEKILNLDGTGQQAEQQAAGNQIPKESSRLSVYSSDERSGNCSKGNQKSDTQLSDYVPSGVE